ncbi:iron-siderophore ABC transporter substrate-binding protein [Saccharospirillum sp.]|uniref:iron-siderophore ABC transporter substrate-binding protein n=1 Tax=Saccharospirillum sp. TaxID=2033801 RepID=UPI0034A0AE37
MKTLLLSCLACFSLTALADFPVTIEHKYGSVTLEDMPQRVLSVGYTEQDDLLALGITPIALRPWGTPVPHGVWPWAEHLLGEQKPIVLPRGPLDFEAIADLNPDLIVGVYAGLSEEDYDKLSLIAPVIAEPGDYVRYATPWEEQFRIIATAVGKRDLAEKMIAEIEQSFAQVRRDHPEFVGKEIAAGFYWDGNPGAYRSGEPRSRFFTEIGFSVPALYDEEAGDAFYAVFSPERIDVMDVDLLVWYWDSPEGALEEDPLVKRLRASLKAHQEGREIILDDDMRFALSFSSYPSLRFALDELVPKLDRIFD